MTAHFRAHLLLPLLTLVVCCGLYPLVLFGVGQIIFPSAASGSLITENDAVRGSRLIAQSFTDDAYFWPRPSAASYNGAVSGASNWGASNPKLRDRVAQQLGPLVKYKSGSASAGPEANKPHTPQEDIERWFAAVPDRVAVWATDSSVAPANWAKTDQADDKYGLPGEYILQWAKDHPEIVDEWKKANPNKSDDPKPEDLVGPFFASFAKVHPAKWPAIVEMKQPDGTIEKRVEPVSSDAAIPANFFDLWLSDPANKGKAADIEQVVADMVMTSGSGLDPHITLRNALSVYQLDRVAAKRTPPGGNGKAIHDEIGALAKRLSFTPLSGLVGEPLVNVLELNRELDAKFPVPATTTTSP